MTNTVTQRQSALIAHAKRSILQRLWESYVMDTRDLLSLYLKGDISEDECRDALLILQPAMRSVDKHGEIARHLKQAEIVVVNSVMEDLVQSGHEALAEIGEDEAIDDSDQYLHDVKEIEPC
ncbi:MAG: hypothetical protein JXM79_01535 [Sedimentisphaerales bacterium]|nr:hypothetical protein [Sedimentisphaerales bacterium]